MATGFDETSNLATLFVWLIFGYLSLMLNCDLQRFLKESDIIRHIMGYLAFYLLFTSLDSNNTQSVSKTLLKTFIVYTLFILATKANWPYLLVNIILLLTDQMIKNHIIYLEKKCVDDNNCKIPKIYYKIRQILFWVILIIIFIGFIHYTYNKINEFGDNFSIYDLIITHGNCKDKKKY